MAESDEVKHYYGIRYVMENKFEFMVHRVVMSSHDGSNDTRIAAMGTKLQGLYDSLSKFTPNRIYIYHEQSKDQNIENNIKEYCSGDTIIEHRVNEDKNDMVNTACTFFSDMNKKQESASSNNGSALITEFMNEINETVKNNEQITIDQDYKWIRIGDNTVDIKRDKPYPLMILCWSLSLLAVKDCEDGWYEKAEFEDNANKFVIVSAGPHDYYDDHMRRSDRRYANRFIR